MNADLLAELRGLHDPPMTLGDLLADGLVALALGLICAWLLVQAIRLFSTREVSPEQKALHRLAEVKSIDGEKGVAARVRLLLDLGNDLPVGEGDMLQRVDHRLNGFLTTESGKALRAALYRPGVAIDLAQFDDDLGASLRRVAR